MTNENGFQFPAEESSGDTVLVELGGQGDRTIRPARPALRNLIEEYKALEAELRQADSDEGTAS